MNPQGSSFIPKGPVQSQFKKKSVRKVYVLTYVSYILFFAAVFSSVGVFFYQRFLDAQLEDSKSRLVEVENKFNQSEIESIKRLDEQVRLAGDRMDMHIDLLAIFEEIERTITQALELHSFSYTREGDLAPIVSMSGEAKILGSLLYQREVFTSSSLLTGASFEEVALNAAEEAKAEDSPRAQDDATTAVTFSLKKALPIEFIRYKAPELGTEGEVSTGDLSVSGTEQQQETILSEEPESEAGN